jgi:hypothetical protein
LPVDQISWGTLTVAQHLGIKSAKALKIFIVPEGNTASLEHLVESGKAEISGQDPFLSVRNISNQVNRVELPRQTGAAFPQICDTLIP